MEIEVNYNTVYVDEDRVSLVSKYTWYIVKDNHKFYCYANIYNKEGKQRTVKLHRVLTNCPDGYHVDHINGNGLDNRIENLRVCKTVINCWNKECKFTPRYRKDIKKYACSISIDKKKIHLGYHEKKQDAIDIYTKAFNARLNFINGILLAKDANDIIHELRVKYLANPPTYIEYFTKIDKPVIDKELRECYIDYGRKYAKFKITKEDKDFIKNSNMKQVDLAKMFKISHQYVNDIKKGRG